MNDVTHTPSHRAFWLSVLGFVGCFLIFAAIVFLATRNVARTASSEPTANLTREERQERNLLTPEERKARLIELHANETKALGSYGWVDREKGIVRLPIDRAVELTVRELQAQQKKSGG